MMSSSPNGTRILVVEDVEGIRRLLVELLKEVGYETSAVCNGAEAMEHLLQSPEPAAIVLDINMPVMNGWEFLARQCENSLFSKIPVVLYSAEPEVPPSRLYDTNVVAFVPKSETARKLLPAIEHALERRRSAG